MYVILTLYRKRLKTTDNFQIPYDYNGPTHFGIQLTAYDTLNSSLVVFSNQTIDLAYELKSVSVYLQSDKGIYKPGQTGLKEEDLFCSQNTAASDSFFYVWILIWFY